MVVSYFVVSNGGWQPLFPRNPDGQDVGMKFGDVGCVRISFAINCNPFPAHSNSRSHKS